MAGCAGVCVMTLAFTICIGERDDRRVEHNRQLRSRVNAMHTHAVENATSDTRHRAAMDPFSNAQTSLAGLRQANLSWHRRDAVLAAARAELNSVHGTAKRRDADPPLPSPTEVSAGRRRYFFPWMMPYVEATLAMAASSGCLGELATLGVVLLASLVVAAVAAWLLRHRWAAWFDRAVDKAFASCDHDESGGIDVHEVTSLSLTRLNST
jgi:hypothetical protein